MGWYSLWKWFAPWRKTPYLDAIWWFDNYVWNTPEKRTEREIKRANERRKSVQIAKDFANSVRWMLN